MCAYRGTYCTWKSMQWHTVCSNITIGIWRRLAHPHIERSCMITLGYDARIVFSQIECCLSICLFICLLLGGKKKMADMCNWNVRGLKEQHCLMTACVAQYLLAHIQGIYFNTGLSPPCKNWMPPAATVHWIKSICCKPLAPLPNPLPQSATVVHKPL